MKINAKLMVFILPVIVVGFAIFAGFTLYLIKKNVTQEVNDNLTDISKSQKYMLMDIISDYHDTFNDLANDKQLINSLNQYNINHTAAALSNIDEILQSQMHKSYKITEITVINFSGIIIASTDHSLVNTKYTELPAGFIPTVSKINFFSYRNADFDNDIVGPILLDGKCLGILDIDIAQKDLLNGLYSFPGLGDTGETILIKKDPVNNKYIYLQGIKTNPDTITIDEHEVEAADLMFNNMAAMKEGLTGVFINYKGNPSIGYINKIPGFDWTMISFIETSEAYKTIHSIEDNMLLGFMIALIVISAILLIIATSITRPIVFLTTIMQKYKKGTALGDLTIQGCEEVEVLANVLQQTVSSLSRAELDLSQTLSSITDSVINVDKMGVMKYINEAACKLLGIDLNEAVDSKIDKYITLSSNGKNISILDIIHDTIANDAPITISNKMRASNNHGDAYDITLTLCPIHSEDRGDSFARCVISINDVSEIILLTQNLKFQSEHDLLTGLANRRFFYNAINDLLHSPSNNATTKLAVYFMELDGIKQVNETLGHESGDTLLIDITQRLEGLISEDMSLALFDGDQLVSIIKSYNTEDELAAKANIIINMFILPFMLDGQPININVHIGISQYPKDAVTTSDLLQFADNAMFAAKKDKANSYKFYTKEVSEQLQRALWLKNELIKAIAAKELQMYYQPQINFRSKQIIGVEALMRWKHATEGFISPDVFIDIAEKNHFIHQVTELAVWNSFKDFDTLRKSGIILDKMSINLSGKDFERLDLAKYLLEHANHFDIPMSHISLEITESVFMSNLAWISSVLSQLKSLGFKVALDDFGKGFSSLSVLGNLPIDILKIDKCFVDDINKVQNSMNISLTIINLSRQLNKIVIAEGVENLEQVQWLYDHGCNLFQGYYFAKPMPLEDLIEFYKGWPQ